MIEALNMPYSNNTSKRDEIMSRYRPIAPKPQLLPTTNTTTNNNNDENNNKNNPSLVIPEKFRQSPYLRNIWSHLQARPTRTRKRGRSTSNAISSSSSPSLIRKHHQPLHHNYQHAHAHAFGLHAHHFSSNDNSKMVVELPLLSSSSFLPDCEQQSGKKEELVLNNGKGGDFEFEEADLTLQLQTPSSVGATSKNVLIVSPRPVRPVGSTINIVGPIKEDLGAKVVVKTAEEVEEEAEMEKLPVVVSDGGNKVRVVNSAYKELVGQPECGWLDSIMVSSKRIGGHVVINLPCREVLPVSGNGFSTWVRIEWESNVVNVFCQVFRLVCESKDYLFYWKFHTQKMMIWY